MARSDTYQHLFREVLFTPEQWGVVSNTPAMADQTTIHELLDLDEDLRLRMWQHIDLHLTANQRAILQLVYLDYTQWEIADKLGINQSSVHKTLHGNSDYSGPTMKRYGGIGKKLTKIILHDPDIRAIMQKIEEIYDDDFPVRLPHYRCFRRLPGSSIQYHKWLETYEHN